MEKGYKKIYWLFIFIFLCLPFGFKRYVFSLSGGNQRHILIHLHAILMLLWCALLIIQPLLLRHKKLHIHKRIGKLSYVLAPLLIVSMIAMIKLSYLQGQATMTEKENLNNLLLPFSQTILFGVYYVFAMLNKNKLKAHMRFILVSSLTLLGPTIGRFDFSFTGFDLDAVNISLLVMELILILCIIYDLRQQKNITIYAVALAVYAFAHFAVYYLGETQVWQSFANLLI